MRRSKIILDLVASHHPKRYLSRYLVFLLAYRGLVVQLVHGPEEVQALGTAEFSLLHCCGGERIQDFLQQVHLARVRGVDVQLEGVVAVLGVRRDIAAVL